MGDMADMMYDNYVSGLGGDGEEEAEYDILKYESVNSETDKAWNITINGKSHWLPKSQCSVDTKEKKVHIPCWLISKNRI